MKLADSISSVLKSKGRNVWSVTPDETVYQAIERMADKGVGALLVMSDRKMAGVISERDYARKVILKGRSSKETKVKEIMGMQNPVPTALRVAVVGGGCSGFQYHMAFENQTNDSDEVIDFNGLKVAVDQMSSMYLEGVEIDYIETIEGAGFKFNNPNVKSTCGCGSSFSV